MSLPAASNFTKDEQFRRDSLQLVQKFIEKIEHSEKNSVCEILQDFEKLVAADVGDNFYHHCNLLVRLLSKEQYTYFREDICRILFANDTILIGIIKDITESIFENESSRNDVETNTYKSQLIIICQNIYMSKSSIKNELSVQLCNFVEACSDISFLSQLVENVANVQQKILFEPIFTKLQNNLEKIKMVWKIDQEVSQIQEQFPDRTDTDLMKQKLKELANNQLNTLAVATVNVLAELGVTEIQAQILQMRDLENLIKVTNSLLQKVLCLEIFDLFFITMTVFAEYFDPEIFSVSKFGQRYFSLMLNKITIFWIALIQNDAIPAKNYRKLVTFFKSVSSQHSGFLARITCAFNIKSSLPEIRLSVMFEIIKELIFSCQNDDLHETITTLKKFLTVKIDSDSLKLKPEVANKIFKCIEILANTGNEIPSSTIISLTQFIRHAHNEEDLCLRAVDILDKVDMVDALKTHYLGVYFEMVQRHVLYLINHRLHVASDPDKLAEFYKSEYLSHQKWFFDLERIAIIPSDATAKHLQKKKNLSHTEYLKVKFYRWFMDLERIETDMKIIGNAQYTGTPGHAELSLQIAYEQAKDPDVSFVFMDLSIKKAIGLNILQRPDVTVIKNGKVHLYEIRSKTDKKEDLSERMATALNKLPAAMRGGQQVKDIPGYEYDEKHK